MASGYLSGPGTTTAHMNSAFSTALHNGNWSNYFRQTNTEAVRAGLNAIKPILKGVIPTITKSILKYMWRDANNE